MAERKNEFELEGFSFCSKQDMLVAENELKGVEYLKKKTNMKNPKSVLVVYNKIVAEGLFHTPIGMKYLIELQKYLLDNKEIDNNTISQIPVEPLHEGISKKKLVDKIAMIFSNSKKAYRERLKLALITNVILVFVIVGMFIIAKTSNQVNILNYEEKIVDKYASWEQDLTERENKLKEK